MKKEKKNYGKITVGYGTSEQRELQLTNYVRAQYKGDRVVSVSEIEDGTFVAAVENIKSTGRNPQSSIWLSKESFIALLSTSMLYFKITKEDIEILFKQIVEGDEFIYTCSDNLNGEFNIKPKT